ncbi:nose resistant to fluoxetine protein 6-like isoform X2 [Dermacentor albipictus]|uniref:nose resistant to fluoxetine protein 6-like isoform X2 n=1 Tax=Dermacentor albipictus TaxID=60249 RepID=UPI0038FC73F6
MSRRHSWNVCQLGAYLISHVIDASAKYPTGLFQGTWSDLGSFDECIETVARDRNGGEVARGQYCNVYVKMANDTSFFDEMLPNFIMAHERSSPPPHSTPAGSDSKVTEGVAKAIVSDCTTNEPKEVTQVQLVFICFLGVVIFFTVVSTIIDVCCSRRGEKPAPRTTLRILLTAFSMPRNTRVLLALNRDRKSDSYKYRFVHGLRFFSILWIVLGHSSMALDPVISRYANVLHVTSSWIFCIISTSFLSVDTFFFLSGFLLAYNILKMKKNPVLVGTIAVLRRIIRVTVPMFFVLMCFCLLPLAATGPNTVLLFSKFHSELERHWWRLILHIRNFANANELECFSHLWYLSTDFQLFFVCVIILLLFKGALQVKQAVMWAVCLTCGAVCILSRYHRNGGFTSTGDWIDVVFSFVDRLLWSSFLACLVFACANRKAGFLGRFLSWRPFVPLSRLSFGVYLVHMPLLITGYALTRERVYYSILGVASNALSLFVWRCILSFCLFLVCELPTSIYEKTLFVPGRVKRDSENKDSGHKTRRTVITYICPRLVVTQDQTTQASTIHLDQWCHL